MDRVAIAVASPGTRRRRCGPSCVHSGGTRPSAIALRSRTPRSAGWRTARRRAARRRRAPLPRRPRRPSARPAGRRARRGPRSTPRWSRLPSTARPCGSRMPGFGRHVDGEADGCSSGDDVLREVALEAGAGDPLERLDVARAGPRDDVVGQRRAGRRLVPAAAPPASRARTACRSWPGRGRARTSQRPRSATNPASGPRRRGSARRRSRRSSSGVGVGDGRRSIVRGGPTVRDRSAQPAELELVSASRIPARARRGAYDTARSPVADPAMAGELAGDGQSADVLDHRVEVDVLVVLALLGLGRGREDRLRQSIALAQTGRQRDAADRAGSRYSFQPEPAR